MRRHFESGLAFLIVAVVCLIAGLLQFQDGSQGANIGMFAIAGFWLIIAIAVRRKAREKKKDESFDLP